MTQSHISCPNDFSWIRTQLIFYAHFIQISAQKKKWNSNSVNPSLRTLNIIFLSCRNLNKGSIKYQSYQKSRKINAFGQEKYAFVTTLVKNKCFLDVFNVCKSFRELTDKGFKKFLTITKQTEFKILLIGGVGKIWKALAYHVIIKGNPKLRSNQTNK